MSNDLFNDLPDMEGTFLMNEDDPVFSHYLAYLAEDIQNNPDYLQKVSPVSRMSPFTHIKGRD